MLRTMHLNMHSPSTLPVCNARMTIVKRVELLKAMLACVRGNGVYQQLLITTFGQPSAFDNGGTHIRSVVQEELMLHLLQLNFTFERIRYNCHHMINVSGPLVMADMALNRHQLPIGCVHLLQFLAYLNLTF